MGPRARRDGTIRVDGGLAGVRPAGGQGDTAQRGGGQGLRARSLSFSRRGPLGEASPSAHAFPALILDLELDTTRGGLEGHGGVEEETEEECQERAVRPHAVILPCGGSTSGLRGPTTPRRRFT